MVNRASLPSSAPAPVRTALDGFIESVQADESVVAAFLGGSFASETWDEYSDLDLYVIVEDAQYQAFFSERTRLLAAMGQVVLAEDYDGFGFDLVVFMLANGVEGELGMGRRSDFAHIHGGPFRTLVDRAGVLEGFTFELRAPTQEQRQRSIGRTVPWFWRQISLFAAAAARRRPWTAQGYLEQARHEALNLVWLIDAPNEWPGGFEKLEEHPGLERAGPLKATFQSLDRGDQLAVALVLTNFVAREGRLAYEELEGEYPDSLEATVRAKLEKLRRSG